MEEMNDHVVRHPCFKTIRQVAEMGILPEHCLRKMDKMGELPRIRTGNRTLINVDLLLKKLNAL